MIYKRFGQPWTFIFLAVAWALFLHFAEGSGVLWSIAGGLSFAALMSALVAFRRRRE